MSLPRKNPGSPALPDNVIWQALSTRQQDFCRRHGTARKFIDDVGPLAAYDGDAEQGFADLAALAGKGGVAAVFSGQPYKARAGWEVIAEAPLLRMVREERKPLPPTLPGLRALGGADSEQMQELAHLARPGPFGPRTHELGNFFGIFVDGKLAAMAGERMKVPGFTEVSAVCTHPDHIGKGYAGALMARVIEGIEARGETAFLHVRADNDRAIALYERLGFRETFSGYFAALRRTE